MVWVLGHALFCVVSQPILRRVESVTNLKLVGVTGGNLRGVFVDELLLVFNC